MSVPKPSDIKDLKDSKDAKASTETKEAKAGLDKNKIAYVSGEGIKHLIRCIGHAFCEHILPQLDADTGRVPKGWVDRSEGDVEMVAEDDISYGGELPEGVEGDKDSEGLLEAFKKCYGYDEKRGEFSWQNLFYVLRSATKEKQIELLEPVLTRMLLNKIYFCKDEDKESVARKAMIGLANDLNIFLELFNENAANLDQESNEFNKSEEQEIGYGPDYTLRIIVDGKGQGVGFYEEDPKILAKFPKTKKDKDGESKHDEELDVVLVESEDDHDEELDAVLVESEDDEEEESKEESEDDSDKSHSRSSSILSESKRDTASGPASDLADADKAKKPKKGVRFTDSVLANEEAKEKAPPKPKITPKSKEKEKAKTKSTTETDPASTASTASTSSTLHTPSSSRSSSLPSSSSADTKSVSEPKPKEPKRDTKFSETKHRETKHRETKHSESDREHAHREHGHPVHMRSSDGSGDGDPSHPAKNPRRGPDSAAQSPAQGFAALGQLGPKIGEMFNGIMGDDNPIAKGFGSLIQMIIPIVIISNLMKAIVPIIKGAIENAFSGMSLPGKVTADRFWSGPVDTSDPGSEDPSSDEPSPEDPSPEDASADPEVSPSIVPKSSIAPKPPVVHAFERAKEKESASSETRKVHEIFARNIEDLGRRARVHAKAHK